MCKPFCFLLNRTAQTDAGGPLVTRRYLVSSVRGNLAGFLRGALSFGLCFNAQVLRFCLEGGSLPVLHAFLLDVITTAAHSQVSLRKLGRELLLGYGDNFIFLAADTRIS